MIVLQELTRDDIAAFVQHNLAKDSRLTAMEEEEECRELVFEVTDKARGVFLWVTLVVRQLLKSLDNADSIFDLQRRLREIPPGLEEYFRHMFNSIEPFYREQAAQIFSVCFSAEFRPPLLDFCTLESQDGLASHLISNAPADANQVRTRGALLRRRINGRCKDLGEVATDDTGLQFVDFIHRTVKDFLNTRDISDWIAAQTDQAFDPLQKLCDGHLVSLRRIAPKKPADYAKMEGLLVEVTHYARWIEHRQGVTPFASLDAAHTAMNKLLSHPQLEDCLLIEELNGPRVHEDRITAMAVQGNLTLYIRQCLERYPNTIQLHQDPSLLCIALERAREREEVEDCVDPDMIALLIENGYGPNEQTSLPLHLGYASKLHPFPGIVWEFFLDCVHPNQRESYIPSEIRRRVIVTAEAMIKAGANFIQTGAADTIDRLGEQDVFRDVFGRDEAARLLRLRESLAILKEDNRKSDSRWSLPRWRYFLRI
jgi:hypothetical protein